MATNAQRQRRWRQKNRVIYNLRRRNKRKNLRGDAESTVCTGMPEKENDRPTVPSIVGEIPTSSTIDQLRQLVATVSAQPAVTEVKPLLYRNDHGAVISERQWNELQARKRKAKDGGYVLDEYSQ